MSEANVTAALVKELRELTGAGMMDCRKALVATGGDLKAAAEKMRLDGQAKAVKKAGRIAADGVIAVATHGDAMAIVEVNCETDFVAKGDDFQSFAATAAKIVAEQDPKDAEALASCTAGDKTLEDLRKGMVAKIGENITLRRFERLRSAGGALIQYIHPGNRIGVAVALKAGDEELGRDIAMHITASRPQFLSADDVPEEQRESERKILAAQAADSGKPPEIVAKMIDGKLRKFLAEITLLGQPFVKDPDQSVEKVLQARKGEVARFVRFEVGEGIEKAADDFGDEVRKLAGGG